MCISVFLSTLGSPATRDPRPAGLGMLPLHGTVSASGACLLISMKNLASGDNSELNPWVTSWVVFPQNIIVRAEGGGGRRGGGVGKNRTQQTQVCFYVIAHLSVKHLISAFLR